MQRTGQDSTATDDVPLVLKYAGRGVGTIGSCIAIFFGVWECATILLGHPICFLGGLWQITAAFLVFTIEVPCCCVFFSFFQQLSAWVDTRPYWNRAAVYCGLAIPAILLCRSFTILIGSGLIFATGVIYGMMSITKK